MKNNQYDIANHTKEFLEYLLQKFKDNIYEYVSSIKNSDFQLYDDYLNGIQKYKSIFVKYLNTKQILLQGIENFVLKKYPNYYSIELDINQKLPNSNITIEEVVRNLDSGNLQINGLHIVDMFLNAYKVGSPQYLAAVQEWNMQNGYTFL